MFWHLDYWAELLPTSVFSGGMAHGHVGVFFVFTSDPGNFSRLILVTAVGGWGWVGHCFDGRGEVVIAKQEAALSC